MKTVEKYKEYTGKNQKNEEKVKIKPKKLLFFKCGKELKERGITKDMLTMAE
jgi:integration host factor subunit beta